MNNDLKNILSFIKESLEIKNKNIYLNKDYEINLDFSSFYDKYKDLISAIDYSNFNINSEEVIFKIKFINEEKKKKIPPVPDALNNYISLKNENDIISNIDDLDSELEKNGLLDLYNNYDKEIKSINKYNDLIDSYNEEYMRFYRVYKRITELEEKIEVIFGNKLLIWQDNQNNMIERYILEANLEMSVDAINNVISFRIDQDKFKGFVSDFLNQSGYKIKDVNLLNEFVKKFNETDINDEFEWSSKIKEYVNYSSFENEIVNRKIKENEKLQINKTYIFDNMGIIVRNKNIKLWIDDLESIINMCDETEFISPVLNMFEVNPEDEEQVNSFLNDETYVDNSEEEILFPLASNDEQFRIVEKTRKNNIVLVQGPPGTGKSHTIANLISHYISQGKKVIVTSEKAKALEVLRDKIPEKIRSLCIALLTSKGVDKDLEYSVESVLNHKKDENELKEIENEIESLTKKLKENHVEIQDVLRKILELMLKDTVSHKNELKELIDFGNENDLTLMDLAIWLDDNRQFKIIPVNDVENYSYIEPRVFFEKLDDIADEIKNNHYSTSSSVPINNYLNSNELELFIKECIGYKNYKLNNLNIINSIKQSNLDENIINELNLKIKDLSYLYNYLDKEFIKSNITYQPFINKINEILTIFENNNEFIISVEEKLYDNTLVFKNDSLKEFYVNNINKILSLYDNNGKISFTNIFKYKSLIKNLNGLQFNNNIITKKTSKEELELIKNILDYRNLIESIRKKTLQVLNIDLFEKIGVLNNQFGKNMEQINKILRLLTNYEVEANNINQTFNFFINTNLFPISYLNDDNNYIESIINDLMYYVNENTADKKVNEYIKEIRDFYKDYNLQNINNLLLSMETCQIDDYAKYKNLLLHEISVINNYNELKNLYPNLVNDKKELISNYIYNFSFEEKQFLKNNIEMILKYHYIEKYYLILENKEKDLPILYEKRESLIKEEKNIITDLVTSCGWYHQNKNMNYNISLSLGNWLNLKKKLGSGTGKNSNAYLRKMREEMNTAKDAIPVWIMPLDKLIEQYPFSNDPVFDVLIMDESSQSSVFSISALTRAKKVIIVGDDKQISPSNPFSSIEAFNDLRAKYLKNNRWDLQISKDTSIYSIIQTICNNKLISLTEHFRCLPEIIHYSNKTFYNMQINPLKTRSKENTISKPIKTVYVPNATCRKTNSQTFNQTEVDAIINLIGEISNDRQYDNKTIGIISLLNGSRKYIEKLRDLIMQKFGENFINERKIKIGTTYDFQGDERDVIILGMVISSVLDDGERYHFRALTDQDSDKSFNVAASRAKEQMILVHSVTLEELTPSCNRYKLLNYCLNYDNEKEKEYEERFESKFEKDVYQHLKSKGYELIPQYIVGKYRIDFVLVNDKDIKIAIECDGDKFHDLNALEYDINRQTNLERCGWKFIRIRASEFYYNKEESINLLIEKISNYLNGNDAINHVITSENENIEMVTFDNNTNILDLSPIEFKYMVLFSNDISRKEIAKYYNVEYDTVKKALLNIAKRNCIISVDECKKIFKKECSNTPKYQNIINNYLSITKE